MHRILNRPEKIGTKSEACKNEAAPKAKKPLFSASLIQLLYSTRKCDAREI